ncbi:MAG TPA: fasciclin domain-containing protein, partial [Balneolaceae bacterium]|nr:fasciclin domain-containing protein [Balneolaceae bacterium]
HVLAQVVQSTDLTASQTAASLTGEPLWIEADGEVLVNGNATVTSPDIEASNGVIHAVDNVLLPDEFGTVVQNAIKRFNFETLVSAVVDADLVTALSDAGPFTLFAPTDEAFGNLPDGLLESLTTEQLSEILQYHVVAADIKSTDLEAEQSVAALTGENIFVTSTSEGVLVNNQSSVVAADINASNGTIHGVNAVLLPNEFIDVVDIASKNFNLSTLVTLVADAGLVETLKSDGPFTIFAPVNSAFEEISETLETLTAEQVENVLTFHVVPQKILSTDLNPQQTVTTVNGEDIEVIVDGETVTVNGSATVTTVDLEGTNGVIHLIDSVLIPDNL